MSVCGSGATFGFLDRLLFGPARFLDYRHVKSLPNGAKEITVHIRKDTLKSAWKRHNAKPRIYDSFGATPHDENIKRYTLKPLKNLKTDGVRCDGYKIVPVNAEGHVVMDDGTVYDVKNKRFLRNRDTRIRGDRDLPLSMLSQLATMATSPAMMLSLAVLLTISAIFDTGVYLIGKHMGYREAEKGKVPTKLLNAADAKNAPSNNRMIANEILPVPLTLKPLDAKNDTYVHPTQMQAFAIQRAAQQQQQQQQQQALPAVATAA